MDHRTRRGIRNRHCCPGATAVPVGGAVGVTFVVAVAVLLAGVPSAVAEPAVTVTVTATAGMAYIREQVMAAVLARVAGSGVGVQFMVAPAGRPVTVHVGVVATSGPSLVQVAVPVTYSPGGAPTSDMLTVARMSAPEAMGVTVAERGEAGPVPAELIAATVNV